MCERCHRCAARKVLRTRLHRPHPAACRNSRLRCDAARPGSSRSRANPGCGRCDTFLRTLEGCSASVGVSQNSSCVKISTNPQCFCVTGKENGHGTDRCSARTAAESRTRGSDKRRTSWTLRRGIAPHGVLRSGEHHRLLCRHADRLGADFPR